MKKSQLLGIALICATMSSYAESTANISTTTTGSKLSQLIEKLKPSRISHFSIINGPSLDGDSVPNNTDGSANKGDGINSWHQISLGYDLTEKTRFVFNPRFTITYNRDAAGEKATEAAIDTFVTGITSTWYENGRFSFSGGLNTAFGMFMSDADVNRELILSPGGFQVLNFQHNAALSYGTWLWGRYRKYDNAPTRDKAPFSIQPYVSYQVNDKLGYTAFYTQNGAIENDVKGIRNDDDQNFNVMLSYSFSNGITVRPMVTVFKESDFKLSEGNLNVWVSGRFY